METRGIPVLTLKLGTGRRPPPHLDMAMALPSAKTELGAVILIGLTTGTDEIAHWRRQGHAAQDFLMIGLGENLTRMQTLPAFPMLGTMALKAGPLEHGIHVGGKIHSRRSSNWKQEKNETHEQAVNERQTMRLSGASPAASPLNSPSFEA